MATDQDHASGFRLNSTNRWAGVAVLLSACLLMHATACELDGFDDEDELALGSDTQAICDPGTMRTDIFDVYIDVPWGFDKYCTGYVCTYWTQADFPGTCKYPKKSYQDCLDEATAVCSGEAAEEDKTRSEPDDDGFSDYPIEDGPGSVDPCQRCRSLYQMCTTNPAACEQAVDCANENNCS